MDFESWAQQVFQLDTVALGRRGHYFDCPRSEYDSNPPVVTPEHLLEFFKNSHEILKKFTWNQQQWGLFFLLRSFPDRERLNQRKFEDAEGLMNGMFELFRLHAVATCCEDPWDTNSRSLMNSLYYRWFQEFPWDPVATDGSRKMNELLIEMMGRLLEIDHRAVQESALIGLGHWKLCDPIRVEKIIDRFLSSKRPQLPLEVVAKKARHGFYIFENEKEEFNHLLDEAFGDVLSPGDEAFGNPDHCSECRQVYDFFRGKDWRNIRLTGISIDPSAICLIGPIGVFYFFPALMKARVNEQDSVFEEWNYVVPSDPVSSFFQEFFNCFSPAQRKLVIRYIELIDGLQFRYSENEHNEVVKALEFWGKG